MKWKRKTFVTMGPDPTEVVIWNNGTMIIEEFQNVYSLTV